MRSIIDNSAAEATAMHRIANAIKPYPKSIILRRPTLWISPMEATDPNRFARAAS